MRHPAATCLTLLAIFAAVCPTVAIAQDAGVVLQLESTTLEVGEVVDGQLVCTNIGQPEAPTIPSLPGVGMEITNPIPAQYSQMSIVNGRRSQKVTYTYSLRVVGRKEGVHAIPPIVVSAGGSSYQTAPVTVTVQKAATTAAAEGDRYIFIRMSAEPRSLYVTETFTATLVIGIRKVDIQGQTVDVDNLLEYIDGGGSDISIFPTRFSSSEQTLTDSAGQRHPYVLHKATIEVRAEKVGPYSVGPVFLKMNYPTAFRRGFFGRLEASRSRRETARAEAIIVDVKGPPEQGRPDDFNGAIGQYALVADAKPTRIEHGRPLTLSVAISGSPLEGLAGPELTQQSELVSRFDFATDELTGDIEGSAKVFRRAIFPKQPGEQTIPPITWSYFDPKSERYVTLSSKPIPIVVDPRPPGSEPLTTFQAEPENEPGRLTVLTGGTAPNYVDASLVLADQSLAWTAPATVSLLAAPPLFWAAVALIARQRRRVATDAGYARRHRARGEAHRGIAVALACSDLADRLGGLANALSGFVCDRFDLPSGERTPSEIRAALVQRGLPTPLIDEVTNFLETCDAARYAPGLAGSLSPDTAAAGVRSWIAQIDRSAR